MNASTTCLLISVALNLLALLTGGLLTTVAALVWLGMAIAFGLAEIAEEDAEMREELERASRRAARRSARTRRQLMGE